MSRLLRLGFLGAIMATATAYGALRQGGGADFTRFVGVGDAIQSKMQLENRSYLQANFSHAKVFEKRGGVWTLVPLKEFKSEATSGRGIFLVYGPKNKKGVVPVRKAWFDSQTRPHADG